MSLPKITVVTPSFNQGRYIGDTIRSVIGQDYSDLEYLVMDGGSTDDSKEIITKYEKHLAYWTSEQDSGQANAINRGFARSTGDVLCWINSDDMLLPGALHFVGSCLDISEPVILCGNCSHFMQGTDWKWGSAVEEDAKRYKLSEMAYIIQPSSFWTRKAWEIAGPLREDLHYAFDWEWQIRAEQAGVKFIFEKEYLSSYRAHDEHKTGTGGQKRREEIQKIYLMYNGRAFADLAEKVIRKRKSINAHISWYRALGLGKMENRLLRLFMPSLFRDHDRCTVNAILKMLQ